MIDEEIKKIIENEVRPMLAFHGGSIDFVEFKDGVVTVRLTGACHGCGLAELTLKEGVENMLKEKIHGVKSVKNVSEE